MASLDVDCVLRQLIASQLLSQDEVDTIASVGNDRREKTRMLLVIFYHRDDESFCRLREVVETHEPFTGTTPCGAGEQSCELRRKLHCIVL